VGVVFSRDGGMPQTVKVRKEVIVSAGVIGSAQLLMLSGIGSKQHLTDMKVHANEFPSLSHQLWLMFWQFSCNSRDVVLVVE